MGTRQMVYISLDNTTDSAKVQALSVATLDQEMSESSNKKIR